MTIVKCYENAEDSLLKFAVIIARTNGKWIFCKHKERTTWEIPGGHREPGETITETAKRELYEETGALEYKLSPVCAYSVTAPENFNGAETFGMLFYAEVFSFEPELHSEIERIAVMDELPQEWTYPQIQPQLVEMAKQKGWLKND